MAEIYMSFWDHFQEFRHRLRIPLIVLLIGFFGSYFVSQYILQFFQYSFLSGYDLKLFATSPIDGFMVRMQLALYMSFALTIPVLLSEVFLFIKPALSHKANRVSIEVAGAAAGLFALGVSFVYFILLPMVLDFFITYNADIGLVNLFHLNLFFQFIILNLFLGGLVFQLPLIIVLANKAGLVHKAQLKSSRRYTYVGMLLVAGILTPDHTIISQVILSGVLFVLFEVSLWFCD